MWSLKAHKRKRNLKKLIQKILILALIISFSWIWFVPFYVGQRGELAVCKFRFQVLEFDHHDYNGYGDLTDLFIELQPKEYGQTVFYEKIGGWKEYFGFKKAHYQTYEAYFGKEKK